MNTYNHIFDCKFIYSGEKEKLGKNEWTLPSPYDKHMGVNIRLLKAFKKVQNKYDFYMIAPLSLFVNFKNFIQYLTPLLNYNKPLYGGNFLGRPVGKFNSIVTQWASYPILNNQSLNILLKEGVKKKYMDPGSKLLGKHDFANDVWISTILQEHGVQPSQFLKNVAVETYPTEMDNPHIEAEKIRDVYDKYALIRFRSPRYEGQNHPEEKKTLLYLLEKVYNKKM